MEENGLPDRSKSRIPCESWVGQNWPTASTEGSLLNSLSSSQHLSPDLSSVQRPPYNHIHASNQNCLSTLSSITSSHQTALYKSTLISSNLSSTSLFANAVIPSASHSLSFAQPSPHTRASMLLAANHGKNVTLQPHLQTDQVSHLPSHNSYKSSFQPPLVNQELEGIPINLPSCRQVNQEQQSMAQTTFEGINMDSASVAGYTGSHSPATPLERPQWTQPSHCRGATNQSVLDGAGHPNKIQSQQGSLILASTETRRSVVLHQRMLLLKQLADLDKLLELLPPDDSSNGQSPHTAGQSPPSMNDSSQCEQSKASDLQHGHLTAAKTKSRSLLSSDCSSLASLNEEIETCDTLDDPTSTAELEGKDDASADSADDSDPDYLPNSDVDFSDLMSDSDSGSFDESSHSSFSISSEETHLESSPSRKKKATSEGSSLKKQLGAPMKKRCLKNQKSSTIVLPCLNSKQQRFYDRRNYCLFCSKPVSKMARHLESIHSDKTEVAAAFQYPKSSRERQKIWIRLINQGNFAHNKDVLRTGKGHLAVRKRPKKTKHAEDFLHCLYCQGLYGRKALSRHMKMCPEKVRNDDEAQIGRKRIAMRCVLETLGDLGVSDGFKGILSQMTYNDVTQVVMSDKIILQFGEQMFNQHGADVKRHDYIRQNLRQIARLVLEARKVTPLKKLEDFFLPSSFPHVVAAVNVLAGYDPKSKTYSIPSLAIKLGYHLQKACNIVEMNATKSGKTKLTESARNFLALYQKQWNKLISSGAITTLKETKLNTEKKVPFAQDVKRLNFHMENVHVLAEEKLGDSPTPENYAALARVVLARTIIFNRRRAGEVSAMKLTAFMSRKKANPHEDVNLSISDLEKNMCGFLTRVEIRGKCGRIVPVLLKPSFLSALELLIKVRETCGVPSANTFLFGRPNALSAYNGSDCIQKYVKECGAKDPKALTSTKIRKHYATMIQLMNLDKSEADKVLGLNNQVRLLQDNSGIHLDDVRREHAGGPQAASWGQSEPPGAHYGQAGCYHDQPHGETMGTSMGGTPKSVDPNNKVRLQHAGGPQAASWDQSEPPGAHYRQAGCYRDQPHGETNMAVNIKGSHNKSKQKWEEVEVSAVERHMMRFIQGHKVPQKSDCIQCLEAEPQALRTRSWKGVKDYVRNRITALKRQSGTPQASCTNSTWNDELESQRTEHFQQF